ncbi:endoplasmic reticulum mannosyl-oligosaccharide 1,2-alpha-mannosidase isoform X1 [Musca domestica]|uniref:alpha-1,2-Mannosidase n=1 Tax=Musca domestica TaxID=7370 RepID=A0ABM3UVB8_MUSDO|nr:endoplasmic reticulum mannosyl-oligosaccharide 1,2-alpha-mannosidase isoform X1 [Musca domestica]XP_058977472.1 endoplasmic reticulum mannosyl-oligosaccharide 1,2-alpha-mannosidase isoform X1 [Musca domestica]XP_058977475.1 endoplasmic reticulum mannosyl-oligosaccharide 1,2-alpha-mannosidase isoform X1 [Musca domestica]
MSEKSDHITLTLNESSSSTSSGTQSGSRNKSLRRSWNQLPRCQRNLIILIIAAMCISFVFLLPSDLVTKNAVNLDTNGLPFTGQTAVRRNNLGEGHNDDSVNKVISSQGDSADLAHNLAQNILPAPAPQKQEPQPQSDIENVVNIPQTQREQQQEHLNIKPIETAQLASILNNEVNNANNLNPRHSNNPDEDRTAIEASIQDPSTLPTLNGVTIEEFLGRIDLKHLPQKQHFHGPNNERQEAVVNAFRHSWEGYKKYAWGHDNLKPMSESSYDWFGLGLTIIDSLDTMYIMGLEDEFVEARNWVNEFLNFDVNRDVNLFEVTIRILGGLLSAYHLSADKVFLKKSIELGNRLLPCFLSPSGIPYSDVNLAALSAHAPKWSPDSSTSEVTTIQLEFRDLSRLTNVTLYESVAHRVNEKVHALEKNNGLVPIFINANTGTFRNYATISLGARGDSYYEYLIKQWIQTGHKGNDFLVSDYIQAIDGVFSQLLKRTPKENHVYIGELINGKEFKPKMDHLTCYLPGTLLLGHHYGMPDSHLLLAKDLLETCYQTYMKQPTQLAPEISYFALTESEELDIYVKPNDAHNLLRPEFVESLYYFYALTGNRSYQDMGWTIFQAFEKYAKVAHGYSSIGNVKNIFNTRLRDMMESFWLGETLKYFYLLFSNNPKEIDLEKWVFNTEAHPLPVREN